MSVTIKRINDDTYHVNGKSVIKDMEGRWIATVELSNIEAGTFNTHLHHERQQAQEN
jgi:hypothetical protein